MLLKRKKTGDRQVVGALGINDYASVYLDFILAPEIGSISDELLSSNIFNPESKSTSST